MKFRSLALNFLLPLAMSVIAAAVAWWMIQIHIERQVKARPRLPALPMETTRVLVASQPIELGARIEERHLSTRHLPSVGLPFDVYTVESAGDIIGRSVRIKIQPGKPIQQAYLNSARDMRLSHQITLDERAFTVRAEPYWTHDRAIQEGDLVDFYMKTPGAWTSVGEGIQIIQLSPHHNSDVSGLNYQYVTFAVPLGKYAMLHDLYEQDLLAFILEPMLDSGSQVEFQKERHSVLSVLPKPELVGVTLP